MVMDKASSVTVSEILGSAIGDLRPAMEAVAELAADDFTPGGVEGQLHMAEHPAGHLVLKWLIEQDKMKEAERERRAFLQGPVGQGGDGQAKDVGCSEPWGYRALLSPEQCRWECCREDQGGIEGLRSGTTEDPAL
ncbi:hypothetical protein J4Q44_G00074450 [Coregonus suidteri]|uniref:CPL domain-containing protein n=1 Tax=Coregonus suidteri TaxID=861788 RepID=A0AAN8R404_9TELE